MFPTILLFTLAFRHICTCLLTHSLTHTLTHSLAPSFTPSYSITHASYHCTEHYCTNVYTFPWRGNLLLWWRCCYTESQGSRKHITLILTCNTTPRPVRTTLISHPDTLLLPCYTQKLSLNELMRPLYVKNTCLNPVLHNTYNINIQSRGHCKKGMHFDMLFMQGVLLVIRRDVTCCKTYCIKPAYVAL